MLADVNTAVTNEVIFTQPISVYQFTGASANTSTYVRTPENKIKIEKYTYENVSGTVISELNNEFTNYRHARTLMFKSDMTKRKEFKLIFSDLYDMLSNRDVNFYDTLLSSINVNSSSMYVLQSLLRLSYTYREQLDYWEPLLKATRNKYLDSEEYNVDMELKGLST